MSGNGWRPYAVLITTLLIVGIFGFNVGFSVFEHFIVALAVIVLVYAITS